MLKTIELSGEELAALSLRSIYSRKGYEPYRMSKFEEYDLYSRNKDFLLSNRIITFTDTNGKLMALKPDVTLSIIKNTRDAQNGLLKLYYDERVYRVGADSSGFREIRQTGLECMGSVDGEALAEVLELAAESLLFTGRDAVLNVSHLSVLEGLFDRAGLSAEERVRVTALVTEKNVHELKAECGRAGVSAELTNALAALTGFYGTPEQVFSELAAFGDLSDAEALGQLRQVCGSLPKELRNIVRVDFSVTGNTKYYNGIVFKGFIEGIPSAVLSGGQYDGLMASMGRKDRAVGFAVYMDLLERLCSSGTARYNIEPAGTEA
ncbi:MAG: ATP phosphoribosyltransferase regulatory subunit [Firmicutes bacterium]|nr:ATP phosphoribosyltransferase regulatory subunit [Bacillota bacterium]